MKAREPEQVVPCADELRRLYPDLSLPKLAVVLCSAAIAAVLASFVGKWIGVIPVLLGMAYVGSFIVKQQRFLHSLRCPHCGQAAGETFSKNLIIHLHCRHCGKDTPTDCLIAAIGSYPSKVKPSDLA